MRTYIVNLTNNLIGNHGFDLVYPDMKAAARGDWKQEFAGIVQIAITAREVREMSPKTLGEVMCSFEEPEMPLTDPAYFLGSPERILRTAVAHFLSYSILYRLDEDMRRHHHDKVPPYPEQKKKDADYNPLSPCVGP